jgi:arylsulfatase A-like enzyme
MVHWLRLTALLLVALSGIAAAHRAPNIVLIFCDDLGYADVGCYGAKGYKTPNIDRLARQGVRFTDFYVAQAVCSASRAALLTGCYPNRIGIFGALSPASNTGIHSNEVTLGEMLRARGYATAIFGKWHLGHQPQFLPTRHGFDEYYGLPYSNDMWPLHPTGGTNYPPLPLIEGETIVQLQPDQTQLAARYTEHAVDFITRHKGRPFFLYLPHSMPHVPLHVSAKFAGRTKRGLYGDVIEEIDWSVGEVMKTLKKHQLDEQTLVLFASDNGPWQQYGNHAGSTGPFREAKGTSFEGGVRVPFIARWPGRIAKNTICREPAMSIDLLPTLAELTGGQLPSHAIDGLDIWPLMSGRSGVPSPHDALYFYWGERLEAVRSGPWKLVFAHDYIHVSQPGSNGRPGKDTKEAIGNTLFNLERDPGEFTDLSRQFPEVVARLNALGERARKDLGDSAVRQHGAGVREPGRIAAAKAPAKESGVRTPGIPRREQ